MATITENYVNFDVSKLLKEKRFDEKTKYVYCYLFHLKKITMIQEDKELLLKDLCSRLPYYPILNWKFIDNTSKDEELKELSDLYIWWITKAQDCEVKPYLRPMSSMTKEERKELLNLLFDKEAKDFYIDEEGLIDGKTSDLMKEGLNYPAFCPINVKIYTDYLNAHHFDWRIDSNGRTFIEKGLALKAPEGMYEKWTSLRGNLKEDNQGNIVGGLKL